MRVFGIREWPIADKSFIDHGHFSFGMQNLLHDTLVNIRSKILGEQRIGLKTRYLISWSPNDKKCKIFPD